VLRLGLVAVLTIVRLQLRGWEIGGGAVQPPVVEPVDVLEGGDLDLLDRAPRTRRLISSVVNSPIVDSARALS